MTRATHDQADGLRRLLSGQATRVVAVFGMHHDDGATVTAMNLASALVLQGRDVLLIDEHHRDGRSASATWALPVGPADGRGLAVPRAASGVSVLGADAAATWPAAHDSHRLCEGGMVLIDAALDSDGRLSARAQAADELVLVLRPQAGALTAAYAGVKRLHYAHGIRKLRFLVNGVSGPDEAGPVMANLARTGSQYLAVSLEAAGWVRADAHHADAARLCRSVVEAYPASPAAQDFRRIADAMGRPAWRTSPAAPVPDATPVLPRAAAVARHVAASAAPIHY